MLRDRRHAIALPLLLVTGIWVWWVIRQGAFFGVVFLPGSLVLLALLGAMLLSAPFPARLRGWPAVALASLFAIAAFSALSAIWSPAPDTAIADAHRAAVYAVAFGLGLWTCLLLGRNTTLALLPSAVAGGVVALVTLVVTATGDSAAQLVEGDGTLRYPLGYRNAAGAYFLISAFVLIVLAAERSIDWRLRGLAAGLAALCVDLALLAQSRGSVIATAVAVTVLVAVARDRLRIVGWLVLVGAGAALALPWTLDVYAPVVAHRAEFLPDLHSAAAAAAVASALTLVLGLLVAGVEPRVSLSAGARRGIGAVLLGGAVAACLVGAVVLVSREGGPAKFLEQGSEQISGQEGNIGAGSSRFGLDLRTQRGDFWRVALKDGAEHPLIGEGAGSFRSSYLLDRDGPDTPEDPHSVELLMFSELGVPGLVLLAAFLVGAVVGALRSRRLGPATGALVAGALAAGAYWLTHASVEWFWPYPALTAPVVFMLGAAAAPALGDPESGAREAVDPVRPRRGRWGLLAALALLGLTMIPPFLSDRYTNGALRSWPSDPAAAYDDLNRAADLNRLSVRPLLAEAVIAEQRGEVRRAVDALQDAERRQPDNWTSYFLEARVLAPEDPRAARGALAKAEALYPGGAELVPLRRRLKQQ